MLELHIENYKEFLEGKTEIISNEQFKIVEYEQLLLVKRLSKSNVRFLKSSLIKMNIQNPMKLLKLFKHPRIR